MDDNKRPRLLRPDTALPQEHVRRLPCCLVCGNKPCVQSDPDVYYWCDACSAAISKPMLRRALSVALDLTTMAKQSSRCPSHAYDRFMRDFSVNLMEMRDMVRLRLFFDRFTRDNPRWCPCLVKPRDHSRNDPPEVCAPAAGLDVPVGPFSVCMIDVLPRLHKVPGAAVRFLCRVVAQRIQQVSVWLEQNHEYRLSNSDRAIASLNTMATSYRADRSEALTLLALTSRSSADCITCAAARSFTQSELFEPHLLKMIGRFMDDED